MRVFSPTVESYFSKSLDSRFFLKVYITENNNVTILVSVRSLSALQITGWGGGCGVHLCAGSVSAESVQRAQCLQQSDDPVLQAFDRGAVSLYAGPAPLRLTLLLCHAGRWSVYTLGLEGLIHSHRCSNTSCVCVDVGVQACLYVVCYWMHFGFMMLAGGWSACKSRRKELVFVYSKCEHLSSLVSVCCIWWP